MIYVHDIRSYLLSQCFEIVTQDWIGCNFTNYLRISQLTTIRFLTMIINCSNFWFIWSPAIIKISSPLHQKFSSNWTFFFFCEMRMPNIILFTSSKRIKGNNPNSYKNCLEFCGKAPRKFFWKKNLWMRN